MKNHIEEQNLFHTLLEKDNPLSQSPVFIVGFPRSGTTLLQSLIATQGFETLPETHYFGSILPQFRQKDGYITESTEKICKIIREMIPLSIKAKEFIAYINHKKHIDIKILFEIIVMDYLKETLYSHKNKQIPWLEKTPEHATGMELIASYYPKAKFIYIIRNPLKSFSSWRNVSSGWGDERVPVENHCDLWRYYMHTAENFNESHRQSIYFVKLEDLIESPEIEMKKITSFLQIEFDKTKLENRSQIAQKIILPSEIWKADVNQPLDKNISERNHKDTLTPFECYRISINLLDLLNTYHYNIHCTYMEKDASSLLGFLQDVKYYNTVENGKNQIEQLIYIYNEWIQKDPHICQKEEGKLKQIKIAMENVIQYRFSKQPLKKVNAINQLISLHDII